MLPIQGIAGVTNPRRFRARDQRHWLSEKPGRGTVLLASAGLEGKKRSWAMRQELLTPEYTTRWADLPVAKA